MLCSRRVFLRAEGVSPESPGTRPRPAAGRVAGRTEEAARDIPEEAAVPFRKPWHAFSPAAHSFEKAGKRLTCAGILLRLPPPFRRLPRGGGGRAAGQGGTRSDLARRNPGSTSHTPESPPSHPAHAPTLSPRAKARVLPFQGELLLPGCCLRPDTRLSASSLTPSLGKAPPPPPQTPSPHPPNQPQPQPTPDSSPPHPPPPQPRCTADREGTRDGAHGKECPLDGAPPQEKERHLLGPEHFAERGARAPQGTVLSAPGFHARCRGPEEKQRTRREPSPVWVRRWWNPQILCSPLPSRRGGRGPHRECVGRGNCKAGAQEESKEGANPRRVSRGLLPTSPPRRDSSGPSDSPFPQLPNAQPPGRPGFSLLLCPGAIH